MDNLKVLGIDLAKNVFQLCGTDSKGVPILNKRLSRKALFEFLVNLKPCLIGIESCGGAHYFAREFQKLGHEVKMMAPKYVKPYVVGNKNDGNDAAAIAEAVTRPRTRFVPIKNTQQQDVLMIHRIREQLIKQRTALSNQIRGLLAEYGIVFAKGLSPVRNNLPLIIEDAENSLSFLAREGFLDLFNQFQILDEKINIYDKKIERICNEDQRSKKLLAIEGIGPISATALVATIGDISVFKNGRHLAAYLGLVPKQKSSGNTIILQGISKKGDAYLRRLLIHGARSVIRYCKNKTDKRSCWIAEKSERSGKNVTTVAVANKNARYVWALLAKNETYKPAMV